LELAGREPHQAKAFSAREAGKKRALGDAIKRDLAGLLRAHRHTCCFPYRSSREIIVDDALLLRLRLLWPAPHPEARWSVPRTHLPQSGASLLAQVNRRGQVGQFILIDSSRLRSLPAWLGVQLPPDLHALTTSGELEAAIAAEANRVRSSSAAPTASKSPASASGLGELS